MAKPNFKSKDQKDSKDTDQLHSDTPVVSSTTSTETAGSTDDSVNKVKLDDDVADAINKHSNDVKSAKNSDRGNAKHQKPNNSGSGGKSNTEKNSSKVVSSTATKLIENVKSNFQNGQVDAVTRGWIERIDENSVYNQINEIFQELGINGADVLTRRGDLLRQYSQWAALLKARPNKSKGVYVIDDSYSDKSISSETIWNNLYKQRRPFRTLFNGVPQVNATVYPDICYNLKFINMSTNGKSPNLDPLATIYANYGTLQQNLTSW